MSGDKSAVRFGSVMTLETINPNVCAMQYAVRGPVVLRAAQIQKELQSGSHDKPFSKIIWANLGDCHATGQKPNTFLRQVLALCLNPTLFELGIYPDDAKAHARKILNGCGGGSIGAYADSTGLEVVRRHVAEYIETRDGFPSNYEDILLSNGAGDCIKSMLMLLMTAEKGNQRAGVMIPVPRYPLYTATLSEYGGLPIGYYLDEDNDWALSVDELQRALNEARGTCVPRAIVVINPGNPTGQVLSEENIKKIIKFAHREKLVILADEVYQKNVYAEGCRFVSFKKVLRELEESGDISRGLELASFMSASKGFVGECGLRGGSLEAVNFASEVKAQLYKSVSAVISSTTVGQAALDVVVNPPQPGDPSHELFVQERDFVLATLKEKAELIHKTFNSVAGIRCNPVQGSMYAFPKLDLPLKAIEAAKQKNQQPDEFYCFELLEATGICVVPGSGFGQKPGTYHFRTTILPPVDVIRESMERFKQFHLSFIEKYSDGRTSARL